jgi:hypothetical protein
MQQQIYADPYNLDDWDTEHCSRCFVHLVNTEAWKMITGQKPPTQPPTAKTYSQYGLPWFDYYAEGAASVQGAEILSKLKSVAKLGEEKRENPLPENESCQPVNVVKLHANSKGKPIREGDF